MLKVLSFGLLFAAAQAFAAVKEEPVTYKDGDTTLNGFIVYDDAVKGKRPGIVVVHEWWGITAHTRSEARKFAEQGTPHLSPTCLPARPPTIRLTRAAWRKG